MKKILFGITSLTLGGAEKVLVDLANELSKKYDVTIFTIYAKGVGYDKIYVMSGEIGLYEKYGFIKIGNYETIYNSVEQLFVKNID